MRRIMVVDDHLEEAVRVSRFLEAKGYDPSIFSSAEEALEGLKFDDFDLVLTDVVMQGKHGQWLLQEIRQDPGLKGVPVILWSAEANGGLAEMARALGAPMLLKPVFLKNVESSYPELLTYIERAFACGMISVEA